MHLFVHILEFVSAEIFPWEMGSLSLRKAICDAALPSPLIHFNIDGLSSDLVRGNIFFQCFGNCDMHAHLARRTSGFSFHLLDKTDVKSVTQMDTGSLPEGCCTVQVIQAAEKLPGHRSLQWPALTPLAVMQWTCLQQMFRCHAAGLTGQSSDRPVTKLVQS